MCLSEVMTFILSPPNLNSSVWKLIVFVTPMAWCNLVYLHLSCIQLKHNCLSHKHYSTTVAHKKDQKDILALGQGTHLTEDF